MNGRTLAPVPEEDIFSEYETPSLATPAPTEFQQAHQFSSGTPQCSTSFNSIPHNASPTPADTPTPQLHPGEQISSQQFPDLFNKTPSPPTSTMLSTSPQEGFSFYQQQHQQSQSLPMAQPHHQFRETHHHEQNRQIHNRKPILQQQIPDLIQTSKGTVLQDLSQHQRHYSPEHLQHPQQAHHHHHHHQDQSMKMVHSPQSPPTMSPKPLTIAPNSSTSVHNAMDGPIPLIISQDSKNHSNVPVSSLPLLVSPASASMQNVASQNHRIFVKSHSQQELRPAVSSMNEASSFIKPTKVSTDLI